MPATTTYGVDLLVELGIGRAADAGRWGQSDWGQSRWGHTDTVTGDWVDVTCDVLDDVRLTAGSNTDDGVTRRWESASAAFTLDGSQWDPWNGPHADVIGDRTPARISWRYPPDPPPAVLRRNLCSNPSFEVSTAGWGGSGTTVARSTEWAHGGAASCKVTTTGASASNGDIRLVTGSATVFPPGIAPGNTYTMSAYINSPVATAGALAPTGRQKRLLFFYSTDGVAFVQAHGPQGSGAAGVQRLAHTFTVPANATGAILAVGCAGSTTQSAFVTYVDEVLIEPAPGPAGAYFDGSTPDTTDLDYAWTGPANASTSTATTVQHHDGTWIPTFTGYIATRGYAWAPDDQQAAVACVDGTSVLVASDRVAGPIAGDGESAAARVARIAAAALWPGPLDVTAGGIALQGTPLDAVAWAELLEVADTDLALLWIDRAGALSYRPRGRVGQGIELAGRLVVCPAGPADVQVMTLGRNQPSVTRNRVEIARRPVAGDPDDVPVVARLDDRQSIARYQAHDYKRTDLWHTDDGWSATVAQAVLGAGAYPSPAPGELALDTVTGDPRVPALLLTVEPDMTFDVVDDGGRTYRQAVVGWDMALSHDGIEAVLHVEDVTRWTNVAHWGTAHWGVDRWGIGGI